MRQKGFTLLEVLVTMVIMSIGLLGLAALMASSLRNNHSSYQRTQAAFLAYDIIDRMRVNRIMAVNSSAASNYNVAIGAASASTNLALADVNDWKTALASTLPAGDGSVTVASATGATTVIVQWNDSRGTGGSNAQQIRVDTQL
ncbi:type IV pilus modification protein PilV [Sulfuriferula nivalis]|uniref:Type IV pilus modification protein PilV n=1 Tax=Sulfuriferula nivalis TaxID=2675298 RepID=A0A809RHX2_9PROT|nr:type IV pilus modification protein PilV [Sulfuriferula nivalis]BBP01206.1 type IV pilus modification protein PilV [Sulfuriferula nivalis]